MELIFLGAPVLVLIVLGLLAVRFGVDSRCPNADFRDR